MNQGTGSKGSLRLDGALRVDADRPLYLQIAESVEASVLDGSLPEESQAPSTNDLAAFHRINPATAAKGVNQLVADGTLYKRRGIGMFVSRGARARLLQRRREEFAREHVDPLVLRASRLGLGTHELQAMVARAGNEVLR